MKLILPLRAYVIWQRSTLSTAPMSYFGEKVRKTPGKIGLSTSTGKIACKKSGQPIENQSDDFSIVNTQASQGTSTPSQIKKDQAKFALLSADSRQVNVHREHNMDLEVPADLTEAIREVVEAARHHGKV